MIRGESRETRKRWEGDAHCAFSRLGVIASISSINTREGAAAFAEAKSSRIVASDSPLIPLTTSGADIRKNLRRAVQRNVIEISSPE